MTLVKKTPPFKYANADTSALIDFVNHQHIDVTDAAYGAVGNDVGNSAPAIHAAVNDVSSVGGIVYIPPGVYRITSPIVFPADREVRLVGAGPQATVLHVTSGTTATPGIIHIRGSELRSSVEQLQIFFDQPDTTVRTAMTHYVPAIFAQNVPRFRIQHVRICNAWEGIDMRGNSNAEIHDLEISHFNTGFQIDGALDTVRVSHLHDWVFGCTANQIQAVFDPNNVGMQVGRVDGLFLSEGLFICGTGIRTFPSAVTTGACNMNISNCGFDTFNGIFQFAGVVRVTNSYFTTLLGSGFKSISATVGNNPFLQISNCYFLSDAIGSGRFIDIVGSAGLGFIQVNVSGCMFNSESGNHNCIVADATAGGLIHFTATGNQFLRASNVAYTQPTIFAGVSTRATVTNNIAADKGTGGGNFITVDGGGTAIVNGNIAPGWGLNYGNGTMRGGNNLLAAPVGTQLERNEVAGYLQASGAIGLNDTNTPTFAVRRYTGTLNGSGAANVAHGLSNLFQTGLIVQAWYKGGGGAMGPLTIVAIDGTNIVLSGGPAGATYRVTAMYSSNAHAW